MAYYALINASGVVEQVIAATPSFLADADPAWRARWATIEPVTRTTRVSPGSGFNPDTRTFVDAEPGKRWDRIQKTMVPDPTYVAPPRSIEERLADLEAAGGGGGGR